LIVEFFEWRNLCEADRYLNLDEFLERHRTHEIIVVEEAIHTWPTEPDELRQVFGDAQVEYLGKESPHWADNDGLYYVVTPKPKKVKPRKAPEPIHVVVYPF
jgi:hypothetical protein